MGRRIAWKFFGAFALLTFVTVFILDVFVVAGLRRNVEEKISQRLYDSGLLAGEVFKQDLAGGNEEAIQNSTKDLARRLNLRITVIDKEGKVLGDSQGQPGRMENHRDRREVIEAMEKGVGQSTRSSKTVGHDMKYLAVRVDKGVEAIGVVRISLPVSEVRLEMRFIQRAIVVGAVAAAVISLVIAYFVSRTISRPIARMKETAERIAAGDLDSRVTIRSNDELGELGKSLNLMAGELRGKMERLRQMDRVRTDFVANVSHELKTPLTSIRGFVETLEDGAINDNENARRFLAIIKKHAERLGNIINDLLRLSELEAGGRMEMAGFDLKGLIDEVVMGFGHSLGIKRQTLSVEAAGGDFVTQGDRDKLEQVFVNLIDNAIKYTKEGGQIKVRLAADGDCLTVAVEDNGIGIPEDDIEHVFERFYRVDKAHSREVGGTGLGLSIAKHIVLAHNGQIRIDSEPGRGTKVIVTLVRR